MVMSVSACSTLLFAVVGLALIEASIPSKPLPLQHLLAFEREGHVVTRGLLSQDEFQLYAKQLRSIAEGERYGAASHSASTMDNGGLASHPPPFLQNFNPHRRHHIAKELAMLPALAATAAALLGVSCVRLYQDAIFWKRPGDDLTMWHADLWTSPISTNRFVSVWLPLQHVSLKDSPLFFRSRTHHDIAGLVHDEEHLELGVDPDDVPDPGIFGEHHAPLAEGDATWHHGWTIHGAPALANDSPGRLAYTASYFEDGSLALRSAVDEEDNPSYTDWLNEVEPGKPAQHRLLPIAHSNAEA